jgi:hypothetical protein
MKFQDRFLEIVKNEQLLKNIRSGLVLGIAVVLPLGYFMFAKNLTIERILNISFGALIIIVWATLQMVTKETKTRATDDKYAIDEELKELDQSIQENKKTIVSMDKSLKRTIKWSWQYNQEQQELHNETLTNETIGKLKNKAVDYRLDGKESKALKIEQEIEKLKLQPLVDKTFEKYDIKLIANYNSNNRLKKKKKGNSEINVDPTKMNKKTSFLSLILRSVGIGIFGSIPIALSESVGTIIAFYAMYLLTVAFTIVVTYLLTSYIVDKVYKPALKRIVDIQEILIEHLQQEEPINEINIQDEFVFPKEDIFEQHIKKEA